MQPVINCLDFFCKSLGHKVNYQKSQIFVSKNVDDRLATPLANMVDIPLVNDLGKYLCIHGRVFDDMFQNLIDRFSARFKGWKLKFLTLAERQILTQSVLNSIPVYVIQTIMIPIGVCNKLEQLMRRFLWGGTEEQSKCSLVNWATMAKPNAKNGLGVRYLHQMNMSFMEKLGWRILDKTESLWVKVIARKYMKG